MPRLLLRTVRRHSGLFRLSLQNLPRLIQVSPLHRGEMTTRTLYNGDVRALVIFGSYLSTCTLLTAVLVRDLYRQYLSRHKRTDPEAIQFSIRTTHIFVACAVVSLSITWYYMTNFFSMSYQAWALQNGILIPTAPQKLGDVITWMHAIRLGPWLEAVQLFRDAWEVAMETPGRLVWSQPIFFITAAWAFFIGHEGAKRQRFHPTAWLTTR